jgi:hypothetical protein
LPGRYTLAYLAALSVIRKKKFSKNGTVLQKMTECHSTLIFMKRIAKEADTIPRK